MKKSSPSDPAPLSSGALCLAIRQLKEVGFTLREIALLLAERDVGRISPARMRKLAREQLGVIDQRIARLQVAREYAVSVAEGDLSVPSAHPISTKRRTAAPSQH